MIYGYSKASTKTVDNEKVAKLISNFTGISKSKLIFVLNKYGFENIFARADELELTDKRYKNLMELKEIIFFKDDNNAKR